MDEQVLDHRRQVERGVAGGNPCQQSSYQGWTESQMDNRQPISAVSNHLLSHQLPPSASRVDSGQTDFALPANPKAKVFKNLDLALRHIVIK